MKSGEIIDIPIQAYELLEIALKQIAEGNTISIIEEDKLITTQQAGKILNVSRPHIVKLLENGEIPFQKVGTHRRIKLSDIQKYQNLIKDKRSKILSKLTKQAQELNLGY